MDRSLPGPDGGQSPTGRRLRHECEQLKLALAEATVQLRIWRIGPAWGHRKVAAMMRADGHQVSTSTVQRALRRRGLLLPTGLRADRRSWARLRKRVFRDPPRQRNRVWQMDFSEFETARGGIWRICAVIDYATKYCSPPPSPRRLAARSRRLRDR